MILIVGGGMAGASLAIALGRAGHAVELFDAQTFPRDKPCGEGIMPAGVSALRRLGVPDGAGGAPFDGVRYHVGTRVAVGPFPSSAEHGQRGRGQRRLVLDRCLFERAAATPGVTARQGVSVEGPVVEDGRVVGVRVDGDLRRASLVVAADGAHSRFRHRLGLNVAVPRTRVGARRHYRLAGRTAPPWVDIFLGPSHEFYVTPLPDGEVLVALLAESDAMETPLEPMFDRWRMAPPVLRELLDGAEPISPLLTTPLAATARKGFAPGVVLLGDAAGFIDPITGGGIAQALITSERLAQFIVAHGVERADAWLPSYERERDALLRDYRLLTRGVLALSRRPALARAALTALSWTPPLFSYLVGVSAGTRSFLRGT
ncbi:MAG TPA: NAD(P)/FAD-dependent oxidoreductase [Vicinamibacterales bacterium]|nr:NAD(P)/FAD-dependent oxidoreductase [Vicinamibacterales bacterium]